MYEKTSKTGDKVVWKPSDDGLGVRAMELTPDTGVPEHANLPDEANVPVEADVARNVRRTYSWLEYVAEYDGEDAALDYDDREDLRERYEELREEHEDDEESDE